MTIIRVARHDESMVVRPLTATDVLDALPTGVYTVPNQTVADALPLPEHVMGVVTTSSLVENAYRQKQTFAALEVPRTYTRYKDGSGWHEWLPDTFSPVRLTAENSTSWDALPDGVYWTDLAAVQTGLGLPARVGWIQKMSHPTLAYGWAQMVEWTNGGTPKTWAAQRASAGWQGWLLDETGSGGSGGEIGDRVSHLWMEDAPGTDKNLLQIEHYGDGSGKPNGQTYGIDLHNYPGAQQAIVIHQYSNKREAIRLDNTDSNAGIYINNTQNLNLNPGKTGQGAAFLKFHPYNMDDFLNFAYLDDDLTWRNDGTGKTWSFQSAEGDVLKIKNAAGEVVASINQAGDITSAQMTSLESRVSALENK